MSESDTSTIDNKKDNGDNLNAFLSGLKGFLISFISFIIIILLYFSTSSLVLFVCKLAQSNILPTENNCYPYTNNVPSITEINTNIFTNGDMSEKLKFPYNEYNKSNKILDIFRVYKNSPSSNFLANYFIAIIEQLLCFNYASINNILNSLNGLPEGFIIGLGPIITSLLFAIMLVVNFIYTIYLWFANMYWFFKTNTNDSGDGTPKWEDVGLTSPVNFSLAIGLVILFVITFFISLPVISIIPFIILSYCCLTSLLYSGMKNNKKITSINIIADVLKCYKLPIVILISICMVLLAFSKLGAISGIFSLVTIAIIYYGYVSLDVFNSTTDNNLSPLVSDNQAIKKCVTGPKGSKHGFLYNMLIGQNGGNITNQIKRIGKKINS
jgi:hypothetical protein